jgi:hypothetical protein
VEKDENSVEKPRLICGNPVETLWKLWGKLWLTISFAKSEKVRTYSIPLPQP